MTTRTDTDAGDGWIDRLPSDELLNTVCPPLKLRGFDERGFPVPCPPLQSEPAGALALWNAEVRAGLRTVSTPFDALARAAAFELQGLDELRAKLPLAADYCFRQAERVLVDAAKAKKSKTVTRGRAA